MKWYLSVPLVYISLMANDVEYFSMYLLLYAYLLWKNLYSSRSFTILKLSYVSLTTELREFFTYFLYINPLPDRYSKYFLPF